MRKVYIEKNIEYREYRNFLHFCEKKFDKIYFFERMDFPSLVDSREFLLAHFSNSSLKESLTLKYRTGEEVGYPNQEMRQYEIACNQKSILALMKISERIFDWQQPDLFEDLCFEGKEGRVFNSLAHEHFGYFILPKQEIEELKMEFGDIILEEKDFLNSKLEIGE